MSEHHYFIVIPKPYKGIVSWLDYHWLFWADRNYLILATMLYMDTILAKSVQSKAFYFTCSDTYDAFCQACNCHNDFFEVLIQLYLYYMGCIKLLQYSGLHYTKKCQIFFPVHA